MSHGSSGDAMPSTDDDQSECKVVEDTAKLVLDFGALVNNESMADVVFVVGRAKSLVYAHRVVVAARSDVFAAMLFGGLRETREREIRVPNIERDVFLTLMAYIYTGRAEITPNNAIDLLGVANQYNLISLLKTCGKCIQDSLDASNVCSIMVQSSGYSDIFLLCMRFVEENSTEVFSSSGVEDLNSEVLEEILLSDNLAINEIDLFRGVLRWGESRASSSVGAAEEKVSLDEALSSVIRLVRLPLMSAGDLVKIVKPTGVVPTDLYLAAIEYHAAPKELSADTASSAFYRRRIGVGPIFSFSWQPKDGFEIKSTGFASNAVVRSGIDNWKGIFGSHALCVNGRKAYFEIVVDSINSDKSGMVIGLARLNDKYSNCWGYGGSGYSYPSQSRASQGRQHEFHEGDVIGVLFNGQTRQVSFYRNGTLQFINTRSPPLVDLFPVVYMHYGNDAVAIKENPRLPLSKMA